MRRLVVLLLVVGICLFVGGAEGLYEAISNPHCTVLTYQQFIHQKSHSGWYQIKDCSLNVLEATYKKSSGDSIGRVFLPIHDVHAPNAKTIQVLLQTEDQGILDTVKAIRQYGDHPTEQQAEVFAGVRKEELIIKCDVQGMVNIDLDSLSQTNEQLASLNKDDLASDFRIIEDGRKPQLDLSIGEFFGGTAILVALFAGIRSAKTPRKGMAPSATTAGRNPNS